MNRNTIIAIVIGLVLVGAAAYLLFLKPSSTVALDTSEAVSPDEITFVNLTAQLDPLGFDASVLADPRFMALVDIHTAILPEATGRRDPFSPLGR
ncbi:MAG: hypothetical protein ACM3TU_02135 [Bacillota bacterium]